jgi:hypothetical protein
MHMQTNSMERDTTVKLKPNLPSKQEYTHRKQPHTMTLHGLMRAFLLFL